MIIHTNSVRFTGKAKVQGQLPPKSHLRTKYQQKWGQILL